MKKLLTITAVGVLLTAPAIAVQKCVALSGIMYTSCGAEMDLDGLNTVDWRARCTTSLRSSTVETQVRGVAICASNAGDKKYTPVDSLTISESLDENYHCWCRMISPAVSRWVPVYNRYTNAEACVHSCATECAGVIEYVEEAMTEMFEGGLSD